MQKSIPIFRWKIFVSQYQKNSLENPFVFRKISGFEKIYW